MLTITKSRTVFIVAGCLWLQSAAVRGGEAPEIVYLPTGPAVSVTFPASVPVIALPVADKPVTIDGKLDDAAWQHARKLGPLGRLMGDDGQFHGNAADDTFVRLLADRENLYIAFICHERDMSKLRAAVSRHDGALWSDDCVEVFIGPFGMKQFCAQFIVNPRGVRFDAWGTYHGPRRRRVHSVDWNPKWSAATQRYDDRWTVEIQIPLAAFGDDPADIMAMNFTREQARNHGLVCWAPVIHSFHDIERYGLVTFGSTPRLLPESIVISSLVPGENALKVSLRNPTGRAVKATVQLRCGRKELASKVINVPPSAVAAVDLAIDLDPSLFGKTLSFHVIDEGVDGQDVRFASVKIPTTPPIVVAVRPRLVTRGGHLEVLITAGVSNAEIARRKVTLTVRRQGGDASEYQYSLEALRSRAFKVYLPTDGLSDGKYRLTVDVAGPDGSQDQAAFEVISDLFE